jgi:type 1 glutamine amidotransferase
VTTTPRAHLITGGFPPGSAAGHDMDYARLRLLQELRAKDPFAVTVANDFQDLERWLPGADLLITYVAGPYPTGVGNEALSKWLEGGGRWFALHGTSGGRAIKIERDGRTVKKMVKAEHHQTLGCFFLNHPPLCEFRVSVIGNHRITRDLPEHFTVRDELYLIELQDPDASHVLLRTELVEDPSPPGFGFVYDEDTSLQLDGITRVLGYARQIGRGEIVYVGLGHCNAARPEEPIVAGTDMTSRRPASPAFYGVWETEVFTLLVQNAIAWGIEER